MSAVQDSAVEVMDCDRQAAASIVGPRPNEGKYPGFVSDYRSGRCDSSPLTQAFARHRIEATSTLREQRDELLEALAAVVGIESNGGHGSHPFVRVYFDKPGDEQAFHSLISEIRPMGGLPE